MHSFSWRDLDLMGFGVVGISASVWMRDMKKLRGYD